jgi:hypothetical protein
MSTSEDSPLLRFLGPVNPVVIDGCDFKVRSNRLSCPTEMLWIRGEITPDDFLKLVALDDEIGRGLAVPSKAWLDSASLSRLSREDGGTRSMTVMATIRERERDD